MVRRTGRGHRATVYARFRQPAAILERGLKPLIAWTVDNVSTCSLSSSAYGLLVLFTPPFCPAAAFPALTPLRADCYGPRASSTRFMMMWWAGYVCVWLLGGRHCQRGVLGAHCVLCSVFLSFCCWGGRGGTARGVRVAWAWCTRLWELCWAQACLVDVTRRRIRASRTQGVAASV